MERIIVSLRDEDFDAAVHALDALPEGANMRFCVKRKATVNGNPGVCITWSVRLPDGSKATAQAVTTLVNLESAVRTIKQALEAE